MKAAQPPRSLPPEKLRWRCDPARIPFATTAEAPPQEGVIAQQRAIQALEMGARLNAPGYNMFVCGLAGTSRGGTIARILEEIGPRATAAPDRCYVNNFKNPDRPRLLTLPRGQANAFKKDMRSGIEFLRRRIPQVFEGEPFQRQKARIVERFTAREKELMEDFTRRIAREQFALGRMQVGAVALPEIFPVLEGQMVPIEDVPKLVQEGRIEPVAAEDLERKVEARTRELAEANERLREADRLKTQFLANMSHELRTPMNSIIGYSELMLEETYGELTARQRDRLQTILRNARNLLDLINDLLDISRIEMGKVTLMRRTVHLNRVVETALKTLEPMARQKGLWLQTVLDEGLPPVQADEARLIQILNNLLSNAIKFTREGGVTVTVYPYTDAGDWVAVSVSDTGIGIAPEHLPLIFEEFRQIDPSATQEFGGTGLGLAIVRRLVELHGGRVWVESTLGQGSTFTFILPTVESRRRPELSRAALQALAQKLEPGKRLVLVIDDDPAIEELMRAYLDGQDAYQMLAVRDGEEGIMLAQELQPQAILLDVLLAGKDGWEVLAELKGDPRTAAIPVIILSVIDERGLGLRLGATDYLVKPVRRADVLASLAQVQEHRPMASELIADA